MYRTRVLAAGLLVFAAACSSNPTDSSTLNAAINQDAATFAADGTAEDVDVMTGMDGGVGYLSTSPMMSFGASIWMPPTGRPVLTGCTFANGSFTCPGENRNGLTVNRVVTLKDALGATQAAYDDQTTASIRIVASVAGDVSHGPWTATVSRSRDFTFTGLAGTETTRTVNGTGSENISRSRLTEGGETRSYTLVGTSSAVDVVLPVKAPGVDPWPLSGTVTRTLVMTRTSGTNLGGSVTRTIVITFDGTPMPGAKVNGEGFKLDLKLRHGLKFK